MVLRQKQSRVNDLKIHAATPARWRDIEQLFGERGACGGCWCMFWRVPRKQYEAGKGERNKRAFKQLVNCGYEPGVIGYVGKKPVGWCAVAPRRDYVGLERSRILKPLDEKPVWSVSCLFVNKEYRRKGLASELLAGAVKFAASKGATIVEGYPVDAAANNLPDAFLWHGTAAAFLAAGFTEIERRSPSRPIMRYEVQRK